MMAGPKSRPRRSRSTEEVVPRKRKAPSGPPYNIVFASPCWHRGGLETVTITHLTHLDRDLWKPSILVGDAKSMVDSIPEGVDMLVDRSCFEWVWAPDNQYFETWFNRARIRSIYRLRELAPDVVIGQLCHAPLYAANDMGVPVIAEYWHCGWSWDAMHHPSDVCISVSDATTQRVRADGRKIRVPVRKVYNGIDTVVFRPLPGERQAVRAELGIGPNVPVVGWCGRISPEKQPVAWVRALRRVREAAPGTVGLIMGPPWNKLAVLAMKLEAIKLGLKWGRDLIQVEVPYGDMPRHYAAMDVLLHCRQDEPFGMIIPEALLCGVPVVAFAGGGIPEITEALGNPEACKLVRGGREDDQARAVVSMLERRLTALPLRDKVVSTFGAERMSREFQDILLEELACAASTAREPEQGIPV